MIAFLLCFFLNGAPSLVPEGLPAAPFDLAPGHQAVELRAPLIARTPGTRLVLFVPALARAGSDDALRAQAVLSALPPGSVSAVLSAADGARLEFRHTGYRSWRGRVGLVLEEIAPGPGNTAYTALELDSRLHLADVRLVWLDQLARRVEDLAPNW
jgi:hypothetical protein